MFAMSAIDPKEEIQKYQGYNIQGSLLKARMLYIHVNHGAVAVKQVLETLPQETKELLSKPIYIGEWYPIAALMLLDRAISNVLASGSDKVFEDLGTFSAGVNLSGAYEPLTRKNIQEFLELTAVLHKTYQDFGDAQYLKLANNAALVQFQYPVVPPENFCRSGLGYFRRAVELCGGKNALVRKTSCQRQNDLFCEFRIEWQEY
ncbi:MAG: hypothetical protein HY819_16320 [Acidobacteria bacterium]|nr:hypothetical protein [Acidobacteriota bacterium]